MFRLVSSRAQQQEKKVKSGVVVRECRVSDKFMRCVRHELILYDRVLSPSEVTDDAGASGGAVARTLDAFGRFVLLQLRMEEPNRSLLSYVNWLREYTGTTVSKSKSMYRLAVFVDRFSVQRLPRKTKQGSLR